MQNSKQTPKLSEQQTYCFLLDQMVKQNNRIVFILEHINKMLLEIKQIQNTWDEIEKIIQERTQH